jgi:hypothetical protein
MVVPPSVTSGATRKPSVVAIIEGTSSRRPASDWPRSAPPPGRAGCPCPQARGTKEKKEAPVGVEPTMADLQSGARAGFAREWQRFPRSDHTSDHSRSRRPRSRSGGRGLVEPASCCPGRHPRDGRGEPLSGAREVVGIMPPSPDINPGEPLCLRAAGFSQGGRVQPVRLARPGRVHLRAQAMCEENPMPR